MDKYDDGEDGNDKGNDEDDNEEAGGDNGVPDDAEKSSFSKLDVEDDNDATNDDADDCDDADAKVDTVVDGGVDATGFRDACTEAELAATASKEPREDASHVDKRKPRRSISKGATTSIAAVSSQ